MKKSNFLDKYPVYSIEFQKSEIIHKTMDDIVAYFIKKIENDKIGVLLSVFDQYKHTIEIGGAVNPEIKAAINIVFGFCPAIPNTKVMAIRPRSYGICEMENKFTIDFLEAPAEKYQNLMVEWVEGLKAAQK